MKMMPALGSVLLMTCALGVYAAGKERGFNISASQVSSENGAFQAKDAMFFSQTGDVIAADKASFGSNVNDKSKWPSVIKLAGLTTVHGNGYEVASSDGGNYYPELNSLVVKSFRQATPQAGSSVVSTSCTSSGQIQVSYSNGMVITADQVCTNTGTYGCQGGKVVRLIAAGQCN
ncbi:hypothetical protein [Xanthomonas sacchari]|uniref:hypothetical protein n=1 Tax=Xanthomonas sacchari TaxID=56458 RepID=UPI002251DEE8|nr:hypothetical protein [Xanthomonas sacchari]